MLLFSQQILTEHSLQDRCKKVGSGNKGLDLRYQTWSRINTPVGERDSDQMITNKHEIIILVWATRGSSWCCEAGLSGAAGEETREGKEGRECRAAARAGGKSLWDKTLDEYAEPEPRPWG